jgi:hypothetical protein
MGAPSFYIEFYGLAARALEGRGSGYRLSGMTGPVELVLPPRPTSAVRARQELGVFRDVLGETRLADLRLLISELVVEAIGGFGGVPSESITVRANGDSDRVRAAVRAAASSFPTSSTSPQPGEAGWSLYLVERVSDSWGLTRDHGSATVWLELSFAGVATS